VLPSTHHSHCSWFIDAVLAQYPPGDPSELVGQRCREHVVVQPRRSSREPSPKITTPAEGGAIPNGGHDGAGDDRPHSWHTHQTLIGLVRRHEGLNLICDSINALIQMVLWLWSSICSLAGGWLGDE
jgi:hypothetical protein